VWLGMSQEASYFWLYGSIDFLGSPIAKAESLSGKGAHSVLSHTGAKVKSRDCSFAEAHPLA
jgi:hypothetical protein